MNKIRDRQQWYSDTFAFTWCASAEKKKKPSMYISDTVAQRNIMNIML